MLYENLKQGRGKGTNGTRTSEMSLLLVRPFDIIHKGTQHKVLMVRVDAAGNRNFAVANDETGEGAEAFKWVAERWVEKVIPSE